MTAKRRKLALPMVARAARSPTKKGQPGTPTTPRRLDKIGKIFDALTTQAKEKAKENREWRSNRVIKRFVTDEEKWAELERRQDEKEALVIQEEKEEDDRREAVIAKAAVEAT